MKKIFIITTKDLPCQYERINGFKLDKYIENFLMLKDEEEEPCIEDYILGFQHANLSDDVRNYLYENSNSIPIFKKQVGDFLLYVTLCISSDIAGTGSISHHNYVSEVIDIVKEDAKYNNDDIFVFVHDTDLVKKGTPQENNRTFRLSECKDKLRDNCVKDGHIFIYQHSMGNTVYSTLISSLSKADSYLLEKCQEMMEMCELLV